MPANRTMTASQMRAAKAELAETRAAQRQINKIRAAKKEEQEREELENHLREVDNRLLRQQLRKEAAMRKRQADEWDPEPRVRAMYDDQALRVAAEVPGPGTYSLSARRALKLDTGVSFGAAEFGSPQAMAYDAHTSTSERWVLKRGAEEPGPMTYDVMQDEMRRSLILQGKGRGGTQFAPRNVAEGRAVPDAHNMMNTPEVKYLADLPAPCAYSPRTIERNKGFRFVQSNQKSPLEMIMREAAEGPGPGQYPLPPSSVIGGAMGGAGKVKSELDIIVAAAAEVPGAKYDLATTMRSKGSPRFGKGSPMSMIEQIQAEERKKPGPGAHWKTPTFAEELEQRKYMRAQMKAM